MRWIREGFWEMTPESRTHASPLSSSAGKTCMTGSQAPISQSAQALLARPVSNPFSAHRADSTVTANTCSWNHPPVRDGGKTLHRTLAVHPGIVGHDLLLNAEKSCRGSIVSREEKRGRLLNIDHGDAGNLLLRGMLPDSQRHQSTRCSRRPRPAPRGPRTAPW